MSYNIFSRLKANLEFYSTVERRLAECILADPTAFIGKSMCELAAQAGVSQGSINNFSKKLTGEGFAALKLQIARQLADYEQMIFSTIKDGDGVRDVMSVHIEQTLAGFKNTLELNSEATFKRAAEMILPQSVSRYTVSIFRASPRDFCSIS